MSDVTKIIFEAGIKLYRYDGDNLQIIRVCKYDDSHNCYEVNHVKGMSSDDSHIIDYETAHNKWIKLNPDGIVSFNILKGEYQDVMVAVHKDYNNPVPFAICRQDVVNIFEMCTNPPPSGRAWAGISVNKNNCPAEMKMEDFMLCDDILYNKFVNVYLDDTLEDILSCIYLGRFDNVLKNLEKCRRGSNILGIDDSVKDLLIHHNFMYDFHETFGIVEVPFPITKDAENLLKDVIGQIDQKVISNVYIIPYDKSINLKEFERPYKLMTPEWTKCKDEDKKIFIIGYDIDETTDYLTAKYGTNNKDEIIKQMGFNVM